MISKVLSKKRIGKFAKIKVGKQMPDLFSGLFFSANKRRAQLWGLHRLQSRCKASNNPG